MISKIKPRYASESELVDFIKDFKGKINSNEIDYEDFHNFLRQYGQFLDIEKPSFLSNLYYLFDYQIGYMYWRYFMWNFSGRQDDIQGKMDMHGNWISGINLIDEWSLGVSQKNLQDVLNNKARNTYFFLLPLFLGLIGLYFLYNTNKEYFWILILFFLFTGIAIQVYTNVRPFEPREITQLLDHSMFFQYYWFGLLLCFGLVEKIRIKGASILSFNFMFIICACQFSDE